MKFYFDVKNMKNLCEKHGIFIKYFLNHKFKKNRKKKEKK